MNNPNNDDNAVRECRRILDRNRECPAADTLVSFREDELAPGHAADVAAHLGGCPECARLIERLDEAEAPTTEDDDYRRARDEDRAEVARALGFRVGRPPARPLLERLSWIWETRVPALVPAAVCALLAMIILWPAPPESAVTSFDKPYIFPYSDMKTRGGPGGPPEILPPAGSLVLVRYSFLYHPIKEGTMVNVDVSGPEGTVHFDPRAVTMATAEGQNAEVPCVDIPLCFRRAGTYLLRFSHPDNVFEPVVIKIRIRDR